MTNKNLINEMRDLLSVILDDYKDTETKLQSMGLVLAANDGVSGSGKSY